MFISIRLPLGRNTFQSQVVGCGVDMFIRQWTREKMTSDLRGSGQWALALKRSPIKTASSTFLLHPALHPSIHPSFSSSSNSLFSFSSSAGLNSVFVSVEGLQRAWPKVHKVQKDKLTQSSGPLAIRRRLFLINSSINVD